MTRAIDEMLLIDSPCQLTQKLRHGRIWVNLTQFCAMGWQIDSKTESPETMLIFSSQLHSITEPWLNLSQSDSVFLGQTDSYFKNESKWLDVYGSKLEQAWLNFWITFDSEKILSACSCLEDTAVATVLPLATHCVMISPSATDAVQPL